VKGTGEALSRGGRRRRYVTREDAAVWCLSGRWGPKRVRVTQCWAILAAERLYTELLRGDLSRMKPGGRGRVTWSPPGQSVTLDWQLRANAVWRFGRVFLTCPQCSRRSTRIYVPLENSWPACRRCWGLTYESRQHSNYRGDGWFSPRSLAESQTFHARQRRAESAANRYEERRKILKGQTTRHAPR
jgi:hypothetical protein